MYRPEGQMLDVPLRLLACLSSGRLQSAASGAQRHATMEPDQANLTVQVQGLLHS